MTDVGIVGAQPGTLIAEVDRGTYERRRSSAITKDRRRSSVVSGERRPSIFDKVLDKVNPSRKAVPPAIPTSDTDSETAKTWEDEQVQGETFAKGGKVRFYKPIDTYEGRHRWDPNAEWTEQEEKKVVRKV